MAIDPSIPLGVTDGLQQTGSRPMVTMNEILQARKIDDERVKSEMAQRKELEERQLVEQTYRENTRPDGRPDYDAIVNKLTARDPELGQRVQKIVLEGRKSAADVKDKELVNSIKAFEQGVKILHGVYDQASFDAAVPLIRQMSPGVADSLGTTYDKARVDGWIKTGRTAQQLAEERRNAIADFTKGDADGGALRYLKSATSDEDYQAMKTELAGMGISANILNSLPKAWSPEAKAQIEAMSVSYKESEAIADTKADTVAVAARDAETRRHNVATEGTAAQNAATAAKRAAAAGSGAGTGTDAVGLRQARLWRENQLADLAGRTRQKIETERFGPNGEPVMAPAMTQRQIEDEQARIETGYRRMAGLPDLPDNPTFPRGVKEYLRALHDKYETFEEADAEVQRATGNLTADHPNLDIEQARKELAKQFGVASPTALARKVQSKKPSSVTTDQVRVGAIATLRDGRRVRVTAVDSAAGTITGYEFVR